MSKWRILVGLVSTAQLMWGLSEWIEYSRSVGAVNDSTGAWVYTVLGLLGLLVLVRPRFGIPVAVVQTLVAIYALCWVPMAILVLRIPPAVLPLPISPIVAMFILVTVAATTLLCLLSVLGVWQVARRSKSC